MSNIEPYKKRGVERRMIPVNQYDLNGVFIARYKSISEASKLTGIANSAICGCCKNKRLSASGYMFQYA